MTGDKNSFTQQLASSFVLVAGRRKLFVCCKSGERKEAATLLDSPHGIQFLLGRCVGYVWAAYRSSAQAAEPALSADGL